MHPHTTPPWLYSLAPGAPLQVTEAPAGGINKLREIEEWWVWTERSLTVQNLPGVLQLPS